MSTFEIVCVCFGCFGLLLNLAYGIYKTCKGEIWRWL